MPSLFKRLPLEVKQKQKIKFRLVRERLNGGGYDRTGMYWGNGLPLYWVQSEDEFDLGRSYPESVEFMFRAVDREDAKKQILSEIPNAVFFN